MTARSLKVRSLFLVAAMTAVVSVAVASPLTTPPQIPTNPTVAASPLTTPPQIPTNPTVAASPLTTPPQIPTNPTITA